MDITLVHDDYPNGTMTYTETPSLMDLKAGCIHLSISEGLSRTVRIHTFRFEDTGWEPIRVDYSGCSNSEPDVARRVAKYIALLCGMVDGINHRIRKGETVPASFQDALTCLKKLCGWKVL